MFYKNIFCISKKHLFERSSGLPFSSSFLENASVFSCEVFPFGNHSPSLSPSLTFCCEGIFKLWRVWLDFFFFNKYLIMLKLCFQVWVAMIVFLRKFVKFWEALYNSEAWPVPLTSEVIWGSDINSQLFKWLWDTERRLSAEVQSSGVLLTFYKTLSEKFPKNGKRSQITCHLIHFTQLPAVSKHGWFSQRARRNKIRVPSDPSRLLTKVQSHTNSTVNM